jgi:hypothetical protein
MGLLVHKEALVYNTRIQARVVLPQVDRSVVIWQSRDPSQKYAPVPRAFCMFSMPNFLCDDKDALLPIAQMSRTIIMPLSAS